MRHSTPSVDGDLLALPVHYWHCKRVGFPDDLEESPRAALVTRISKEGSRDGLVDLVEFNAGGFGVGLRNVRYSAQPRHGYWSHMTPGSRVGEIVTIQHADRLMRPEPDRRVAWILREVRAGGNPPRSFDGRLPLGIDVQFASRDNLHIKKRRPPAIGDAGSADRMLDLLLFHSEYHPVHARVLAEAVETVPQSGLTAGRTGVFWRAASLGWSEVRIASVTLRVHEDETVTVQPWAPDGYPQPVIRCEVADTPTVGCWTPLGCSGQ